MYRIDFCIFELVLSKSVKFSTQFYQLVCKFFGFSMQIILSLNNENFGFFSFQFLRYLSSFRCFLIKTQSVQILFIHQRQFFIPFVILDKVRFIYCYRDLFCTCCLLCVFIVPFPPLSYYLLCWLNFFIVCIFFLIKSEPNQYPFFTPEQCSDFRTFKLTQTLPLHLTYYYCLVF